MNPGMKRFSVQNLRGMPGALLALLILLVVLYGSIAVAFRGSLHI